MPDGLVSAASADDHGLTSELGIAQQFDRGVKSIHVEMCDAALAVHRPLDSRTNGKSAKGQATTGRWLAPPACRPLQPGQVERRALKEFACKRTAGALFLRLTGNSVKPRLNLIHDWLPH